jgi:plastocyanin
VALFGSNKFFLFPFALFLLSIIIISISTNSWFFYRKDSYSYYRIAYAATNANTNGTKSFDVTIPKGSANPQVDITKLGPRQWYLPRQITVSVNDTITWTNNDSEAHTVTSGNGAGIESLMNNKRGTPNGLLIVWHSNQDSRGHIHLLNQVHTLISALFILGWMSYVRLESYDIKGDFH